MDFRGGECERAPRDGHANPRAAEARGALALRDGADRATGRNVRDEAVAVALLAADGDEEPAALRLPRVVRHVKNVRARVAAAQLAADRPHHLAESDSAFFSQETLSPLFNLELRGTTIHRRGAENAEGARRKTGFQISNLRVQGSTSQCSGLCAPSASSAPLR